MKTPKLYINNLKNGNITDEMISDVLYSYSKRAKNCRDKLREYRNYRGYKSIYHFDNYEKYENKMAEFYKKKNDILSLYNKNLICIHKQDKQDKIRIYDYEPEYKNLKQEDIIWENCYFDYDKNREIWFADILNLEKSYLYFYYYEFPNHSFHNPINEIPENNNIQIIEIDDLITEGEDINDLLSCQFCDKVYKFLFPNLNN